MEANNAATQTEKVVVNTNDEERSDTSSEYRPTRAQRNVTLISCYLANFSDGWQNNISNPTNVVFASLLDKDTFNTVMKTRISNALLVGAILGVVVFGYTSDMYSRRAGLLVTSSLVAIGTLMATVALTVKPEANMLWYFVVARGVSGFGVGGEYPPSAAAGLEEADDGHSKYRGPIYVSFTTLMATLAGPILMIVYLLTLIATNNNLTTTYHTIYAIGIILPCAIIILRIYMSDSALFHKFKLTGRKRSMRVIALLGRRYWYRLFTTSLAFFIYDFINFPNSIMSSLLIKSLVTDSDIRTTAIWQVVLAVLPVPGVLVGAWLTNVIGRKWTGIAGFGGIAILAFIIGGKYDVLSGNIAAFVVLYGLMQAFGHLGPGATIGLISSESFPTGMRAMGYGVATAFGRTGAAVGTQCFTPFEDAYGKESTFFLAGAAAVLGMGVYWLLPESGKLDLEREDRELDAFLAEKGYGEVKKVEM